MSRHGWLCFALLLALAVESIVAVRSAAIAVDGVTFIEIARDLQRDPIHAMRSQDQHPGYPALLVGAHSVVSALVSPDEPGAPSGWIFAGKLVSIIAGVGCVWLVWLVSRRMYNETVANIAALLVAALPALRQNAADVLSDTPHLCAYLAATWLLQEGFARQSWRWCLGAGAVSGLAFWIRPEGLSVALVGGALLAVAFTFQFLTRRVAVTSLAALACGAMLVVGPYVILAGKLTSKKDPLAATQKPAAFQMPFMDAPPEPDIAENVAIRQSAPEVVELQISPAITVTPPPSGALVERIVGSLQKYFEELGYGFGYVVWIPWFVGHFAPRRLTPLRSSLLLFLALGTFHSMLIIWLEFTAGYLAHRHVMPIIVICAPAAGAGIELLGRMVGALTRHATWSPRFAFTIALILVAVAVPFATREINAVATPVVVAADWVRDVAQPGQTVLANSHYPRFYASLEGPIFGIDATDLNASLRDLRPDFVVLDVDSRLYAPPDANDLGTQYAPAFETRGAGERAWHHVVVYRRIRPNPADSGLRSAGHTGRR